MKKLAILGITGVLLFSLTGCMRMSGEYSVSKDGNITSVMEVGIEKATLDSMDGTSVPNDMEIRNINGTDYYISTETKTYTQEEFQTENPIVTLTPSTFYYKSADVSSDIDKAADGSSIQGNMVTYMSLRVIMPDVVVETNGMKESDYSVRWELAGSTDTNVEWYAYTTEGVSSIESDKQPPVISGYNPKKYYNKVPNIKVKDNVGVKEIVLNGKAVTDLTSGFKQGKNKIRVTDISNNVSEQVFLYDTKKPTVKGAKKGKTYTKSVTLFVKDKSGIKKVAVNGKTKKLTKKMLVKSGKNKGYYKLKIKSSGKIRVLVTDKAGNKTSLKFNIKK